MSFKFQREELRTVAAQVPKQLRDRLDRAQKLFSVSMKDLLAQMIESCLDDLEPQLKEIEESKQKESSENPESNQEHDEEDSGDEDPGNESDSLEDIPY